MTAPSTKKKRTTTICLRRRTRSGSSTTGWETWRPSCPPSSLLRFHHLLLLLHLSLRPRPFRSSWRRRRGRGRIVESLQVLFLGGFSFCSCLYPVLILFSYHPFVGFGALATLGPLVHPSYCKRNVFETVSESVWCCFASVTETSWLRFLPAETVLAKIIHRLQMEISYNIIVACYEAPTSKHNGDSLAAWYNRYWMWNFYWTCRHRLQIRMFVKKEVRVGTGQYFKWIEGFTTYKNVLESTSYSHICHHKPVKPVLLNSMQPSQAPTLICLLCCAILACSRSETWDYNYVIQMNPWITPFLLLEISSHKSKVGACHRL